MQKSRPTTKKYKTVEEMDSSLDKMDLSKLILHTGKVIKPKVKKINLDLPENVVRTIDSIAASIGVSRQPLIKMWIHERIQEEIIAGLSSQPK
jgi:predicted DNA binding CopG/RHH family protein